MVQYSEFHGPHQFVSWFMFTLSFYTQQAQGYIISSWHALAACNHAYIYRRVQFFCSDMHLSWLSLPLVVPVFPPVKLGFTGYTIIMCLI